MCKSLDLSRVGWLQSSSLGSEGSDGGQNTLNYFISKEKCYKWDIIDLRFGGHSDGDVQSLPSY